MGGEKKSSSSLERKVEGYLKPTNHCFFTRYVEVNQISRSAAVNAAVKALREQVTASQKK